jgi:photosystem II stability/assembly factor-like uncharacterized protein
MRSTIRKVCLTLVLVGSFSARPERIGGPSNGSVTDVGPEAGLVFHYGNETFLFRGGDEILVTSGRAGVYKTFNRGESWVRTAPGLVTTAGVEPYTAAFCQSRSAPEIAYAVTLQNGISRTVDFGESWERLTLTANPMLLSCAVDPADAAVVYALAYSSDPVSGLLFKSTDAGRSFSTVGAGLPEIRVTVGVAISPTNPQTVYIANWDGETSLYVSSDGGLNFRALPNAPNRPSSLVPHPTQDGTLLILTDNRLFRSLDGGESFVPIGMGLPPPTLKMVAFDPTDASVVYVAAGVDGLFRSVDGGLTFDHLAGLGEAELLGFGITTVGVSRTAAEDPPTLFVGTSLGPFRSDDGGDTFIPIHGGYRGTQVNDLAIDAKGRLLVATINSVGAFRSTAPGMYQIIGDTLPRYVATSLQVVAAAPDDPDLYLVAGTDETGARGIIFRTTDGGGSWSRATVTGDPFFQSARRIAFAPSDARRVYLVAWYSGLFRSDDGGQSFERQAIQALASIAVDPSNPDVLYLGAADTRGVFKSTDGGRTLQQLAVSGTITDISLDPDQPEVIYAASRTGAVVRSLDGGRTFAPAGMGLKGDRVLGLRVDPARPTRLFAWMRGGGLFRSDDRADTWTAVDTGETLRRSTAQAGLTAMAIDGTEPVHVYLGNASVLQFVNP